MTVTDQLKLIDDKIKSNQTQYRLGGEAAKISPLPSKDLLEKYEYLTGEDLKRVCFLVKFLKRTRLKVMLRVKVISIMTTTTDFTNFTKGMMNLKTCH